MLTLASAPLELILQIVQYLDLSDLKTLSSLDSEFRRIFAPLLFRTVRFTNLEADEDAVSRILLKHGAHASKLHFDFHLLRDSQPNSSNESLVEGQFHCANDAQVEAVMVPGTTLSAVASRLLSGELLAEVNSLTINFVPDKNFHGKGWGDSSDFGSIYIWNETQATGLAMLEEQEERWPSWRRGIAHMWNTLCRNRVMTSLEIVNLPALPLSSWQRPPWSAFLGRLTTLILGLGGGSDERGWMANTFDGYRTFLEALGANFFDHTTALKKLHLLADPDNLHGDNDKWPSKIGLREEHVPLLEELRLQNCFIDDQCCRFLCAATRSPSSLTTLHLIDCMANKQSPTWEELFTRLSCADRDVNYFTLKELVVANDRVWLRKGDEKSQAPHLPVLDHSGKAICVRSSPMEEQDGKSRPFAYGEAGYVYGMMFWDEDRALEAFRAGADMDAYRRLMRLIAENKQGTYAKRI